MKIKFVDSKIEIFIKELSMIEQAEVSHLRELLEGFGHEIRMPYSKKISGDLFELRGKGKTKVRVLYAFRDDSALILHIFIKKTQKIPVREIDIALHKLWLFDNI